MVKIFGTAQVPRSILLILGTVRSTKVEEELIVMGRVIVIGILRSSSERRASKYNSLIGLFILSNCF